MAQTLFSDKCIILHDLYINHHDDDDWQEFFAMNDLGIPLAVAVNLGGAIDTEIGRAWIDETFDNLCKALNLEDTGFDTIDEMMDYE